MPTYFKSFYLQDVKDLFSPPFKMIPRSNLEMKMLFMFSIRAMFLSITHSYSWVKNNEEWPAIGGKYNTTLQHKISMHKLKSFIFYIHLFIFFFNSLCSTTRILFWSYWWTLLSCEPCYSITNRMLKSVTRTGHSIYW